MATLAKKNIQYLHNLGKLLNIPLDHGFYAELAKCLGVSSKDIHNWVRRGISKNGFRLIEAKGYSPEEWLIDEDYEPLEEHMLPRDNINDVAVGPSPGPPAEFLPIAENIIKIRGRLSQTEFAKRLGTQKGIVHSWESGKSMPGAHYLAAINRVFGVNVNWLLSGEGEPYIDKESQDRRIDNLSKICVDLQNEVNELKKEVRATREKEKEEEEEKEEVGGKSP